MKTIKKIFIITAILATISSPFFLSGCQTVKGMGQDIEAGGKAITKAAEN